MHRRRSLVGRWAETGTHTRALRQGCDRRSRWQPRRTPTTASRPRGPFAMGPASNALPRHGSRSRNSGAALHARRCCGHVSDCRCCAAPFPPRSLGQSVPSVVVVCICCTQQRCCHGRLLAWRFGISTRTRRDTRVWTGNRTRRVQMHTYHGRCTLAAGAVRRVELEAPTGATRALARGMFSWWPAVALRCTHPYWYNISGMRRTGRAS